MAILDYKYGEIGDYPINVDHYGIIYVAWNFFKRVSWLNIIASIVDCRVKTNPLK